MLKLDDIAKLEIYALLSSQGSSLITILKF